VLPERMQRGGGYRGASRVAMARYMALAGVASSILLAAVLFVSAFVQAVVQSVDALRAVGHEEALKKLVVVSVRHADALLIATALLIIGIGLYSIFIERVDHLPQWLAIRGFEDLKEKLASVVVVALAVDFFTVALEWNGAGDIMAFGAAIAAVLLGLSAYVLAHRTHRRTEPAAAPRVRDAGGEMSTH
jgi:uncharacterized membrane protein YqhA